MLPYVHHNEEGLVAALQGKSREAFNYLYDQYAAALYGVIIKVVGNENELAQDLLQEVFVKIWHHIESYDAQKGRLYTWMLNIARNTAIDMVRSTAFQRQKSTTNLELASDKNIERSSSNVLPVESLGLENVMKKLEEKYRILIELCYFKGYTQNEVSQELNIPLGTVKTRIRSALLQLKEIMA